MTDVTDKSRVASLLTEAITSLCKQDLKFEGEFTIEGLLGITLENKDIFLINIKEIVKRCDAVDIIQPGRLSIQNNSLQILNRPESIFPKRRKRRKASTVSKRKASYPGAESHHVNDVMLCAVKSAPSDFDVKHSSIDSLMMCEDLSLKEETRCFIDIPTSNDRDYSVALLYNDGKDISSDISNHSNGILPKDDHEHLTSFQQSNKITLNDPFPLLGISADWNMDMPLNLADEKPIEAKEGKRFSCKSCGKNYKIESSLKKHRCKPGSQSEPSSLGHEPSQPLDLSITFNNNEGMDASSLGIDLDLDADINLEEHLLGEQYGCICGRTFTEYSAYDEHISCCHKAKLTPYKACEICGKYFFSNSGYVKHKRLHVGAYKFRCDECRKGFFDRTHLQAHMDSSHSKVRRFECVHCFKSFFWKHHLKRHLGTCDKAKGTASALSDPQQSANDTGSPPLNDSEVPWDDASELMT